MRRIPRPTYRVRRVYTTCISRVKSPKLRAALESIEDSIAKASTEFKTKVPIARLHTIKLINDVDGIVSISEMEKVYDRMANKSSLGRIFYDKIVSLAPHNLCPLCSQRIVSTIDHHLPQTLYPALVVTPLNLVPACKDCNFIKRAINPKSGEEETIHPYFDNIEDELWLKAKVKRISPPGLSFYVDCPSHWDIILKKRVKYHFDILKLSELFGSHSGEELRNRNGSLNLIYKKGNKDDIKKYLDEAATSCSSNHLNSWQSAMYRALADSDWFCDGGFNA